jgi:hypothetical protein
MYYELRDIQNRHCATIERSIIHVDFRPSKMIIIIGMPAKCKQV